MARYIEADEAKSVIKANDWSNPVVPQVVGMIIDRIPTADVAPRAEVAREIFEEIMRAMERGVAEADKAVINNTSVLDFRESLCRAGEMYAGHIGTAICKVFLKYTEGQK